MKTINVLVTSAGAGPGIAVIKALKRQSQLPVRVIAADMDPTAAGLYLADERVLLPGVKDPSFEQAILRVIEDKRLDVIMPILDMETPFFASRREPFRQSTGVRVLISGPEAVRVSNDKVASHEVCVKNGIDVPRLYSADEVAGDRLGYPVLIKPRYGIGSKDVRVIPSRRVLEAEMPLAADMLVFEYVKGPEYTADTISDMSGRCLAAAPRQRIVVKAGQSVKGRTVHDAVLIETAVRAANVFGIEGPGCSQWMVRDGKVIFIEMNPRYGTGVSLSIGAGLNIPLLHIKLGLGLAVDPKELAFRDNCYMSRYWEEVFFDGKTFEVIGSAGGCP